jgi:hypothetical protein
MCGAGFEPATVDVPVKATSMLYPTELSSGGRTGFEPVAFGLRRCSPLSLRPFAQHPCRDRGIRHGSAERTGWKTIPRHGDRCTGCCGLSTPQIRRRQFGGGRMRPFKQYRCPRHPRRSTTACHPLPDSTRWGLSAVSGCCVAQRLTGRQVKPRGAGWRPTRSNPKGRSRVHPPPRHRSVVDGRPLSRSSLPRARTRAAWAIRHWMTGPSAAHMRRW